MKKYISVLLLAAVLSFTATASFADNRIKANAGINDFDTTLAVGSVASGDYLIAYDASAKDWVKVDATSLNTGTFGTITATGTLTLDDGTGASPSFVMTDETNESATFSKVDAGFLTITTVAGDGVQVTTGNLKVGNGTPGIAQDGEDAYVEGQLEVDGASEFDGAVDFDSTITIGADAVTASGLELNYNDIATLGTLAASKAWTSDASLDTVMPSGGLLTVQSGASVTLNSGATLTYFQRQVASTTTAITAAETQVTFVSNSADVMTLPEASTVLGARYTFVCGTADDFDINPADATDVIGTVASITGANTTTVLAPAAGDAIRCTDVGSSITLEAVGADLWASIGTANGIWTDVN